MRSMPSVDAAALVRLCAADATNLSSLLEATRGVFGTLSITTEGLIMHLAESGAASPTDNVCHLLRAHGGVWLTPDPETTIQHTAILHALMDEKELLRMLANALQKSEDELHVSMVGTSLLIRQGDDLKARCRRIRDFFAAHGLGARLVPMYDPACKLLFLAVLSPEERKRVKAALENMPMWR